MKFMYLFIIMLGFLFPSTYAAKIYKRVPFTLSLQRTDTLIVNYDFTKNLGVQCRSKYKKFRINFVYKGHQKSAFTPVILQTDHIPKNRDEQLADAAGQFTLLTNQTPADANQYKISCTYLNIGADL